jgi:SAM-dependent methyltransferase
MSQSAKIDFYDQDYLTHHPTWHVEDASWKAQQILKILTRNNLQAQIICDVGCGAGEVLRQLYLQLPEHTQFIGYEVSSTALKLASTRSANRLSYDLKDITLQENDFFDILLCIDVFEHIPDYLTFLQKLKARGAYKIFHIPLDLNMIYLLRSQTLVHKRQRVGHLHYFTQALALETLKDLGYTIIDYFYTPIVIDLPHESIPLPKNIYKVLYSVNPDLTVRVFGGCSLMVLTQ